MVLEPARRVSIIRQKSESDLVIKSSKFSLEGAMGINADCAR
jgi:hypothetical protein